MIFIDKTTQYSNESRNRLEVLKTSFRKNGKNLEQLYVVPNQTGGKLWKLLDKKVLRNDLYQEQNGLCCYCCQKLSFDINNNVFDHHTKIEHFLIKSAIDVENTLKPQAFRVRIYEYNNLMLACAGGETYEVKAQNRYNRLDTKEDISELLGVSIDLLDRLNPDANYMAGERIKYVQGIHCDTKRNDGTFDTFKNNDQFKELVRKRKEETPQYSPRENDIIPIINPTENDEPWKYFDVKPDGSMIVNTSVTDEILKQIIENTLIVLNLNEDTLKSNRKKAFDAFSRAIDLDFNGLSVSIEDYLSLQLQRPKRPFCFVNYLVILNRMGN